MKPIADMTLEELAALVCHSLNEAGVTVTLTGGACVAIWSGGAYVSNDLDFVEEEIASGRAVDRALGALGFRKEGRHFAHPDSRFYVEFPTGPLMVGQQRVQSVAERHTPMGRLRLLKPTDCVKDRLAAFYHWRDEQALEQAILVAHAQHINMEEIGRWSDAEGMADKFDVFKSRVRDRSKRRRRRRT